MACGMRLGFSSDSGVVWGWLGCGWGQGRLTVGGAFLSGRSLGHFPCEGRLGASMYVLAETFQERHFTSCSPNLRRH